MGSFTNRVVSIMSRFSCTYYSRRNFISEEALGLVNFKKKVVESTLKNAVEYKNFVIDVCCSEKYVPFHMLKKFVYMIQTEEDVTLFEKLLFKYWTGKKDGTLTFANFSLGTEIMKMYYSLNQPERALTLIKNNQFSDIFNTFRPFLILQDLLFKNEMHNQVCEVFKLLQERQLYGQIFPPINYQLYQASCYKMNTDESFNDAMKTYEKFIKYKSQPHLNMVIYTVLFALECGSYTLALKYCKNKSPVEINMKLLALTMAGNFEEALRYWAANEPNTLVITKSVWDTFCDKFEDDILKSMNESEREKLLKFKESSPPLKDLTLEYLTEKYLEKIYMELNLLKKKK